GKHPHELSKYIVKEHCLGFHLKRAAYSNDLTHQVNSFLKLSFQLT
ncbi:MAG: hypothetical protein ACI9DG_002900, partial [Oleispira sp.]